VGLIQAGPSARLLGGGRWGRFNCFRMGFVYVYQLSGGAAAVINAPDNYYMRFT